MKRTPLRRRAPLRAKKKLRRSKPLQQTPSMAATERQRAAVAGRTCIVCGIDKRIDPAHLLSARRRDETVSCLLVLLSACRHGRWDALRAGRARCAA